MIEYITIYFIAVLLSGHYIGDFLLQSRKIGTQKISDNRVMLDHVTIYTGTVFMMIFLFILMPLCFVTELPNMGFWGSFSFHMLIYFYIFVTHFATDWCTSRLTARFWQRDQYKAFWNTIGIDQLIHAVTLIALVPFYVQLATGTHL
jgi:hypothetical protein